MSEQKRYTAQEMRHTAMDIQSHIITKPSDIVFDSTLCDAVAMLCQGADAEDEREANEKVKWSTDKSVNDERDRLISENAQLKASKERWMQGTTLKIAGDRCELAKCECTKELRKQCPFNKDGNRNG